MKHKSIKFFVIRQFIVSGIFAFGLTFITFIACFGTLHIISEEVYIEFLTLCNQSQVLMSLILSMTLLIFVGFLFAIFMKRMDPMTRYMSEMTDCVQQIATGDLEVMIPIRQENELGDLASHINQMTRELKSLMEKERQWDKQKYHLITNLSHDLKTPLMSIMGFLELICREKYENKDQLQHYSQIAYDKSIQLKHAIDELFELSKLSNNQMVLKKNKVYLKALAEQVMMTFIPEFEKQEVDYRIEEEGQLEKVEVDPPLMVRVLENLIGNALKYGIGLSYVRIRMEEADAHHIAIHVCNDGAPIKKEDQEKVFARFYRAEKNADRKEGGGVGLAIVKTIVELHGGSISLQSQESETDFKILLPKRVESL